MVNLKVDCIYILINSYFDLLYLTFHLPYFMSS